MPQSARHAFTLVEILIVVVILGILAAIVIPKFSDASQQSAQTAFTTSLNEHVKVANISYQMTGQYPVEHTFGTMPSEYDEYLDGNEWSRETPIGGNWDIMAGGSVTFGVGVYFASDAPTDTFMTQIDDIYDDGDLTSGKFQKLGDGEFYVILEP
jgi:prepilin-type N-terminal cleavage/methylation domain-containing protein